MTSMKIQVCKSCPSWSGKLCGHAVLYGRGACWQRDGRPTRKVGLQNEPSPFAPGPDEKAEGEVKPE